MLYTKFNIDSHTLRAFGIELGYIDCECNTQEKLIAKIDSLTEEQFNKAMSILAEE